eukprot:6207351-Pleurochrysis_carterae.AAC.1
MSVEYSIRFEKLPSNKQVYFRRASKVTYRIDWLHASEEHAKLHRWLHTQMCDVVPARAPDNNTKHDLNMPSKGSCGYHSPPTLPSQGPGSGWRRARTEVKATARNTGHAILKGSEPVPARAATVQQLTQKY